LKGIHLQRNRWIPLAGIAFSLIVGTCVSVCLLAVLFWQVASSLPASAPSETITIQQPTPDPTLLRRQPTDHERQTAEAIARAVIPERDLPDLAHRLQGLSPDVQLQTSSQTPHAYEVGDTETFWLHNHGAKAFFTATATLQYETPHAYWWVEDGYHIPQTDLAQAAGTFENQTYPTNRRLFGSEWFPGIDSDPHIYIYLGNVPGVGGYFSGPDEFPTEIRPFSNQHEMFYINLENARPGNDYFDGILAHEYQHMIHWAIDRNEDTWVSEGLSELAAGINRYDVGGSDQLFLAAPDSQLTTWPELEHSGPHYGGSYLFLTYFYEQYGEAAVRQLVAEPLNSSAGFDAVLAGLDPIRRFDDLFADWLIANYLDDPSLSEGRYGYVTLDSDQPRYAARHAAYPVDEIATVSQYAADYILLENRYRPLSIRFSGSQTVSLVGNNAHSGEYQWWSIRGDEGDTTLTRAFDLSELQQATLGAWMWYDLEADYDYAYVEVSNDGGQTWNILSNDHTTIANPSGNSYGPAFTGKSGSGDQATWTHETFDLTPYAGQLVLVRFEIVTDDAVNRPGLCLDDISIPELGYHADVETGDDGWQAAGWARVTDSVPQRYLVYLITLDDQVGIERLTLDEQMHGTITLPTPGPDAGDAVLVISALAPATTEPAWYSYQVTSD
jgi:immune inhibitor A